MRFIITSAGNNSTFGDVFFRVPTKEEMEMAETTVSDICYKKAMKLYKSNPNDFENSAFSRFEKELQKMCETETAYHFLILKEIAELSRKEGYPIMTEGNLSGSVISYLLGITEYDPFGFNIDNNAIELLWGTAEAVRMPDFSTGIAPQIRPLINRQLNSKYGYADCDKYTYRQISLTDVDICETLGRLFRATGRKPSFNDFNEKIYIKVVRNIADEYIAEFLNLEKAGCVLEEKLPGVLAFAEELKQVTPCDFKQLLRLYAYQHGSFQQAKSVKKLSDPCFFVTRNEFFHTLTYYNIPATVALNVVKKGVWSQGNKRKNYIKILKSYNVPARICEYFSDVTNLWRSDACISRLILKCADAWYQIYFPKEYEKIKNGEL